MMQKLDLMPPPIDRRYDGNGYNGYRRNAKGDVIRGWIRRINDDRNWSRAILGLPLIEPVDPEIAAWQAHMHPSTAAD